MVRTFVPVVWLAITTAYPAIAETTSKDDAQTLHLQVVLDRLGFTPGVIDGQAGSNLKLALASFQQAHSLPKSGVQDAPTQAALGDANSVPAIVDVTLTTQDFQGPFVGPIPKSEDAQAKLPAMGYSDAAEALAERFHTTSALLAKLNPGVTFAAGATVHVPNVVASSGNYPAALKPEWKATLASLNVSAEQPKAAKIVVRKAEHRLSVYDDAGQLIASFPATMGSTHDPLPIGHWKIQGTSYLPTFHFNPELFWDAKPGESKATLKPGPNGPVGVVWMDLDKDHYGIHGTPEPQNIGKTESHGCIRLTNWDAARLSLMVKPGTPADFEP